MYTVRIEATAHAGENAEYEKHSMLVGVQTCTAALEVRFTETRNQPIPLSGIYPRDVQSYHKYIFSTMFIAAFFVIARTWEQPRCLSTEEWINKMWYTMEYHSTVKKQGHQEI